MTVFTIANFKRHSTREITAKFPSRDKVEHAGHFPTSMEMCMDDCLTLTTEKIQQKQFQDKAYEQCCSTHSISPHSQKNTVCSHAEFLPGMESIPIFPGKQFLQGKEKITLIDTCTFTLGMINFLNRYSALSALTYQENFHQLNMETSNMKEPPYLNVNAETTLQADASKKVPRASLIQKRKDIPVTDTFITDTLSQATPMNPGDDIQLPIRKANMITTCISTHISTPILMSVQPQDSLSNKLDQLRKSTVQGNQLPRLSCYINTESQCDKKSLPTDLHKHWNHRETLSIESRNTVMMNTIHMILMSEHSSDSISNRSAQP